MDGNVDRNRQSFEKDPSYEFRARKFYDFINPPEDDVCSNENYFSTENTDSSDDEGDTWTPGKLPPALASRPSYKDYTPSKLAFASRSFTSVSAAFTNATPNNTPKAATPRLYGSDQKQQSFKQSKRPKQLDLPPRSPVGSAFARLRPAAPSPSSPRPQTPLGNLDNIELSVVASSPKYSSLKGGLRVSGDDISVFPDRITLSPSGVIDAVPKLACPSLPPNDQRVFEGQDTKGSDVVETDTISEIPEANENIPPVELSQGGSEVSAPISGNLIAMAVSLVRAAAEASPGHPQCPSSPIFLPKIEDPSTSILPKTEYSPTEIVGKMQDATESILSELAAMVKQEALGQNSTRSKVEENCKESKAPPESKVTLHKAVAKKTIPSPSPSQLRKKDSSGTPSTGLNTPSPGLPAHSKGKGSMSREGILSSGSLVRERIRAFSASPSISPRSRIDVTHKKPSDTKPGGPHTPYGNRSWEKKALVSGNSSNSRQGSAITSSVTRGSQQLKSGGKGIDRGVEKKESSKLTRDGSKTTGAGSWARSSRAVSEELRTYSRSCPEKQQEAGRQSPGSLPPVGRGRVPEAVRRLEESLKYMSISPQLNARGNNPLPSKKVCGHGAQAKELKQTAKPKREADSSAPAYTNCLAAANSSQIEEKEVATRIGTLDTTRLEGEPGEESKTKESLEGSSVTGSNDAASSLDDLTKADSASAWRERKSKGGEKRSARLRKALAVRASRQGKASQLQAARALVQAAADQGVQMVKQVWANIKSSDNAADDIDIEYSVDIYESDTMRHMTASARGQKGNARLSKTAVQPFNLVTERRGAIKVRAFRAWLEENEVNEAAARIPQAQGMVPYTLDRPQKLRKPPVKEPTQARPFDLDSVKRHQEAVARQLAQQAIEEENRRQASVFHARPVNFKHSPVLPPKPVLPVTEPVGFHLVSDARASERNMFDKKMHERQRAAEAAKLATDAQRQAELKTAIKQMRSHMVVKARTVPSFDNPFQPHRSGKSLTIPKSPQWNPVGKHPCHHDNPQK